MNKNDLKLRKKREKKQKKIRLRRFHQRNGSRKKSIWNCTLSGTMQVYLLTGNIPKGTQSRNPNPYAKTSFSGEEEEIPKSAFKKLTKELNAQKSKHDKWLKKQQAWKKTLECLLNIISVMFRCVINLHIWEKRNDRWKKLCSAIKKKQ